MRKVVELFTVPGDERCEEIRGFLEDQDIYLKVRDITKQPLNYKELFGIIRHLDLKHFVDYSSKAYSKSKLNGELPERSELFKIMAEDNDLLVKPIIVAGRLMVVGPNIHKIKEMLQLNSNGSSSYSNNPPVREERKFERRDSRSSSKTNVGRA